MQWRGKQGGERSKPLKNLIVFSKKRRLGDSKM